MKKKILLVDDEPNILAGYKRQLRKQFTLETAESGEAGLDTLASGGADFAVVVSDMRMPGMDGIAFLSEVSRCAPDCVRIMLTGNADIQTCIDAVNKGHIFRFLTKPCPPEDLAATLEAGMRQHQLIIAERELLEGTLRGSIRTMCDILGILNPAAFSRASRIRRYVRHIAAELNTPWFWEFELAAALSQIGCVALPPAILERMNDGRGLTGPQRAIVARHPSVGCQLLAEIPRLELVAQMVGRQSAVSRSRIDPTRLSCEEIIVNFGAQLLRISLDLDDLLQHRMPFIDALSELHKLYGADHPMVEALMSFDKDRDDVVTMEVSAEGLGDGMIAAENITSTSGHILVPKGQRITLPVRMYLQSCAQADGLAEPFKVEVSSGAH